MQKEQSNLHLASRDPFKKFTLTIDGIAGLNTTEPPNQIQDNDMVSIVNLLPLSANLIRKITGYEVIVSGLPADIIKEINTEINGAMVDLLILKNGEAGTVTNGVYATIAPAGTFSNKATDVDINIWNTKWLLIIDNNTGLFSYQPNYNPTILTWTAATAYDVGDIISNTSTTTVYTCITAGTTGSTAPISTIVGDVTIDGTVDWVTITLVNGFMHVAETIKGFSIGVWEGRVFGGSNETINYSAPGSFIDFTSKNGGGFFTVAISSLKQSIYKILPYMDSLYMIGDHAIVAFTGTTISNDPNNWYMTVLFNNMGTFYPNSVVNFNNVIYLRNEYGLWTIESTQSKKFSYKIDLSDYTISDYPASITTINNLNFYLMPVKGLSPVTDTTINFILAYCIDLGRFYTIDIGQNIMGTYQTYSITDHSLHAFGNKSLFKMFAGTNAMYSGFTTKNFDFGYPFMYKVFRYLIINFISISGKTTFKVQCIAQKHNQQNKDLNHASAYVGLWNQFGSYMSWAINSIFVSNKSKFTGRKADSLIFNIVTGGTECRFEISETSDAIYEISNMFAEGTLGRSLV